ncbi:5-cytosine rRNA methyltransferase NSUN4-like [Glandiceps talaboti]
MFPLALSGRSLVQKARIGTCFMQRRFKWKWETKLKNSPSVLALSYFDKTYKEEYGSKWSSIRLALLSEQKYSALVNNYCDSKEIQDKLNELGAKDFVQSCAKILKVNSNIEQKVESGDSNNTLDNNVSEKANENIQNFEVKLEFEESKKEDIEKEKALLADASVFHRAPNVEFIGRDAIRIQQSSPDRIETKKPNHVNVIKQKFNVSPHLQSFVFELGSVERFPSPKFDAEIGAMGYYVMDAASLLPVISLDVQPGDVVLDMCAAPGGKTLALLQTMYVGALVANEPAYSRSRRLHQVISSYIPHSITQKHVFRITNYDGKQWGKLEPNTYHKVLVDVPCTTDRHVLHGDENNIFTRARTKERKLLPELQTDLLCAALKAVQPGGDVVYSTCTLSQQQNDNVITNTLYQCQEDGLHVSVVDTSPLADAFSNVFQFYDNTKYGQLVLPTLKANWGPMYFCKLHRHS